MARKTEGAVEAVPNSWDLEHWPGFVYPHTTARGRYVVRAHRDELLRAGALVRVGRDIVVMGLPYTRWLATKVAQVIDFAIAPNRTAHNAIDTEPDRRVDAEPARRVRQQRGAA